MMYRLCRNVALLVAALAVGLVANPVNAQCDTWQTFGGPSNPSAVYALAVYNGELIIGGAFSNVAGCQNCANIAAWNGSSWHALNSPFPAGVRRLDTHDGALIASSSDGSVARWDGISWSRLGKMNNAVLAMAAYDSDLIVGGWFSAINGHVVDYNFIARWDGAAWHTLGDGMNNVVFSLLAYEGDLIAGGAFVTAGGQFAGHVARWNGSAWRPMGGLPFVTSLAIYKNQLVAAAGDGRRNNYVVRWDGANWIILGDTFYYGWIFDLLEYNGELYACGSFATFNAPYSSHIRRWDGSTWTSVGSGLNDDASAMTVFDNKLIVGGRFNQAGGQPAPKIAAWLTCPAAPCPADITGDAQVTLNDLLAVINAWGLCSAPPTPCPADISPAGGDGTVDINDMLAVLDAWGPCR